MAEVGFQPPTSRSGVRHSTALPLARFVLDLVGNPKDSFSGGVAQAYVLIDNSDKPQHLITDVPSMQGYRPKLSSYGKQRH